MNARRTLSLLTLVVGLLVQADLQAVNTVFSGYFRGDEPQAIHLSDLCGGNSSGPGSTAYHISPPLTVERAGRYTVVSAYQYTSQSHIVAIYRGAFDPAAPMQHLVQRTSLAAFALEGEPLVMQVYLEPGTSYRMVVSTACAVEPAQWVVTFSGPGEVLGGGADRVSDLPEFTQGAIPEATLPLYSGCGDGNYLQIGPQSMTRLSYYFVDISKYFSNNICLEIHSAPLNPNDPGATLMLRATEWGDAFDLPPGDYYLIVRIENALNTIPDGEYFFLLVPSAHTAPVIQPSLAGSWYDPSTPGQGFFIDVLAPSNTLFLGWFTFEAEDHGPPVPGIVGDSTQRWLTAQGPFEGSRASLEITSTTGGRFGSAEPAPDQQVAGSMTVRFEDCAQGWIDYDLDTAGLSGSIPIQRLEPTAAVDCTSQKSGPDRPGPLH